MPILGVTHGDSGESIQQLSVGTKVSIGEIIHRGDKTFPSKLDRFVFSIVIRTRVFRPSAKRGFRDYLTYHSQSTRTILAGIVRLCQALQGRQKFSSSQALFSKVCWLKAK